MPIKHLAERRRYLRLGKVRLGIQVEVLTDGGKVKMEKGQPVMRPKATDYFVIKEEIEGAREAVFNIYGEQPKELDIRFLFDNEEQTFPQYLKMYRGDGQLRCMGDGEYVMLRRYLQRDKDIDERLIQGGAFLAGRLPLDGITADHVLATWQEQYGWGKEYTGENWVPCLGQDCPQFRPTGCRPTGRLLFMIEGIDRLGFWELVIHQHAVIGVNSQLELCRAFTARFLGRQTILHVPFKLRLRGPEKMKVSRPDNKSVTVKVWTPEIEPVPEWVTDVVASRVQLPPALPEPTKEDIWGETPEQTKLPPVVDPEEDEALDYRPGQSQEWVSDEYAEEEELRYDPSLPEEDWPDDEYPEGPPPDEAPSFVVRAEEFRRWIVGKVKGTGNQLASKKQVGYAALMMGTVFGEGQQADVARHQFLEFMFGVKSTKDLTGQQAHALIDWLKADEGKDASGSYVPSPAVSQQAEAVVRSWAEEHGQQKLPI